MDWSLIIFLVIILYFGYRGYRKGFFKSFTRILSVLAGYICALLYSGEASQLVEAQFQLQGIVAFIAASLMLFFGASVGVSLLLWLLGKLLIDDDEVSTASSIGGGVVGLATGALLAIVIVWTVGFVKDMRPAEAVAAVPETNPSKIQELANQVAGKAVASAMSLGDASPEVTKITAAMAAAPADMVQRAQRLANSDDMKAVLNDPHSRAALESGDYEAVRKLTSFQQLIANDDLQALANVTGLLDDAAQNNQAFDAAMAEKLTDTWNRAQRVKNDKRVQEIIGDPEFQQKIQSGNPLDLLTNDRLLELAEIIFADEAGAGASSVNGKTDAQKQQPAASKKLHKWVDDSGRVHYSDVEPDS